MSQRNAGDGFLNTSSELGRHTSHGSNDSEVWLKIVIRCWMSLQDFSIINRVSQMDRRTQLDKKTGALVSFHVKWPPYLTETPPQSRGDIKDIASHSAVINSLLGITSIQTAAMAEVKVLYLPWLKMSSAFDRDRRLCCRAPGANDKFM